MSNFITRLLKPILDDYYDRGFSAGVSAQKLQEKHELTERETFLYRHGYEQGQADYRAEHGEIEEISAEEFDRLTGAKTEIPDNFGFVGTMDDISLVLDEEAV